ncbi:sel1 repeat family protein [Myxococcota bacterium]|nr:sel1 repeat family protein [Myxococcota bacterium]MBU1535137.1 sel1 repeat family protein [Myxococcota bacterium]
MKPLPSIFIPVLLAWLAGPSCSKKTPSPEAAPPKTPVENSAKADATADRTGDAPVKTPKKPYPEHIRTIIASCEKGSPSSCQMLSTLFLKGVGIKKNRKEAMRFSTLAKQNYRKILPEWEKRCHQGDAATCMNAGLSYRDALGTARDYGKAVINFKKGADLYGASCEKENKAAACNSAARVYWLGLMKTKGLNKDPKFLKMAKSQVLKMFARGCDLKYAESCGSLGDFYRDGLMTKKDHAKARELYARGCKHAVAGSHEHKRLCAYALMKDLPVRRRSRKAPK